MRSSHNGEVGASLRHAEARRLHALGLKLVELHQMSKRPVGNGWNCAPVTAIRDEAGGYGMLLAANGLVSIDPDSVELAREGLARCGFDLEELMRAGVRTSSTRPGSGGRSTFKMPGGVVLRRVVFASRTAGTMLELRAADANLQDSLPGTRYLGADGSGPYVQQYADGLTLDQTPELPAAVLEWWARLSSDLNYLREQQALFIGADAMRAVSIGEHLAYASPLRGAFNARHEVPEVLERHGYAEHRGRWAPPTATGSPAVRPIPGRDGLWRSDHASDPLHGCFDAWCAFVVLDHGGDLATAEAATDQLLSSEAVAPFDDLSDVPAPTPERPGYERAASGKILATMRNLRAALADPLEVGARIAFDEFRGDVVVDEGEGWRPLADTDLTWLRVRLETIGFKNPGKNDARDALHLVARDNTFDSAVDWLRGLSWDGAPRIEKSMTTYFGVVDSPYSRAVGTYLFSALAGRVLQPGVKADMAPILVGGQGIGKSRSVQALVPSRDLYTAISLDRSADDLARLMRRKLVVELDELAGMRAREVEFVKSVISTGTDSWVPKYCEAETQYARRCVFFGTSNRSDFLRDVTGARRFLPLEVAGRCDVDALERDRDQLWAEGHYVFSNFGVQHETAERLAADVHADFSEHDVWQDAVNTWLNTPCPFNESRPADQPHTTVHEALSGIGVATHQQSPKAQARMAAVLKRLGFEAVNVRVGGVRSRRYARSTER